MKDFPVYINAAARAIAAQREVRGAYCAAGDGLDEACIVIPKHMKVNTGAPLVRIAGGVGHGRVRVWTAVRGKRDGAKAADLYSGDIRFCLMRAVPTKRKHLMLEDNDPSGFKSKQAQVAKEASKINVLEISKRSLISM